MNISNVAVIVIIIINFIVYICDIRVYQANSRVSSGKSCQEVEKRHFIYKLLQIPALRPLQKQLA